MKLQAVGSRIDVGVEENPPRRPTIVAVAAVDQRPVEIGAEGLLRGEFEAELAVRDLEGGREASRAGVGPWVPDPDHAGELGEHSLGIGLDWAGRSLAQFELPVRPLDLAYGPGPDAALGVVEVAVLGILSPSGDRRPLAEKRPGDLDREVGAVELLEEGDEVRVVVGEVAVALVEEASSGLGQAVGDRRIEVGRALNPAAPPLPGGLALVSARCFVGALACGVDLRGRLDNCVGPPPRRFGVEADLGDQHQRCLGDHIPVLGQWLQEGLGPLGVGLVEPVEVG